MGAGVWILSIIIAIIFLASIGSFLWWIIKDKKPKCTKNAGCLNDEFCSNGKCVPYGKCTKSSECIGGEICSGGKCVQCETSKNCSQFPGRPMCYNNKCVGCVKSSDCPNGICDTSIKKCVQCINDSNCPDGKCLKGSSPELNRCVGCIKSSDCPNGICDTSTNKCVQCINNTQCPTGSSCIANVCTSPSINLPEWSPLKSLETPIGDPFGSYNKYRHHW